MPPLGTLGAEGWTPPPINGGVARVVTDPLTGGSALVGPGGTFVNVSGDFPKLSADSGVVAFWDFSEPRAPYISKVGAPLQLVNGAGSRVKKSNGGPLGNSLVFNGTSDYLVLPADQIGALNLGASTGKAFVLAFIKRGNQSSTGFIAGCWQEDNSNPKRSYGLFIDLPLYGGDNKVCFHVSKTGGASPNIPYSRDYSANGSAEPTLSWTCISGSYDGEYARSYIEGRFEPYTGYTEPGAPNGEGLTYDKNPYAFSLGLNAIPCDFTVGAVKLTAGMSNFFNGELAAVLVMNRAPTAEEITELQNSINTASWGLKNRLSQWAANVKRVSDLYGCKAYLGATATDQSNLDSGAVFQRTATSSPQQEFVYRPSTSPVGVGLFACESVPDGLTTDNLLKMTLLLGNANTADTVRLAIKIGALWYATEATYAMAVALASPSDWTGAETKTLNFEVTAALWRDLTVTPGSALTLAGAARGSNLPSGAITGWGVYSPAAPAGNVRFRDMEMIML